jgi:hypothetical protein
VRSEMISGKFGGAILPDSARKAQGS